MHLNANFPVAIPINNSCLERHAPELDHTERNISKGRGEVPIIMSVTEALPGFTVLIADRLHQRASVSFFKYIQRSFYTVPDQFGLALDYSLI